MFLSVVATCVAIGCLRAEGNPGTAADSRIYAQILVNETMAANPDLLAMGIHATLPGTRELNLIACSRDPIGIKSGDDAVASASERKTILGPSAEVSGGFEVVLPLKAAPGRIIGALGLVFRRMPGDDEVKLHARALAIRKALAAKIPSTPSLFRIPAPWMSRQ
jgi:hypothetical protein